MNSHNLTLLALSKDKRTLFITSSLVTTQQFYETGSILIDFLELDYMEFSIKYSILNGTISVIKIESTNEYSPYEEENDYKEVRKKFLEVAHICFDTNLENEYKFIEKGNIQQRYAYYSLKINSDFQNSLGINLKLSTICAPQIDNKTISLNNWINKINNGSDKESADYILTTQPEFEDSYWFYSWTDIMFFELMNVIKGDVIIKKCENCKRYFIPSGRPDAIYCNRVIDGSKKTCEKIGAMNKYSRELKKNPILYIYRKEYKRRYEYLRRIKQLLKSKNKEELEQAKVNEIDFNNWSESSPLIRDIYLEKYKSVEESSLEEEEKSRTLKEIKTNFYNKIK